jgi:hydroxyacylglutathione hydrolase
MEKLKIITMVLGIIETNTYLVFNPEDGSCAIIDPADRADDIEERIRREKLKPACILLTHGHGDHFKAADEVRRKFEIPVWGLDKEEQVLLDPDRNTSVAFFGKPLSIKLDRVLHDGEEIRLLGKTWRVIATPGHTGGSCCYYIAEDKILLSGDTLFFESYGRCDMPGGDEEAIVSSIREKLFLLPDDVDVYPGHMRVTTIGHEKTFNPLAVSER